MADHDGVPEHRTSFVGRIAERDGIESMLERHRLVSVVGPGGAGKTRLVAEVVRGRVGSERTWWVDVSTCERADDLAGATLRRLSERVGPGGDALAVIARRLGDGPGVLVLDNCEHLVEACARFADDLLSRSPTAAIVATSREPLGVEAEAVVRLGPLDAAAAELFVQRAELAGRTIGPEDAGLVQRICDRVDRLPLAIELAAARCGTMALADIATGLDRSFDLLAGGSRTSALRHRSMRACLEWSMHLLGDADRAVLERLSVFPSDWSVEVAVAVVADEAIGPAAVAESVHGLTLRSLVTADLARGRYRLLETVRDHAADTLQRSGAYAHWRDRHLAVWAGLVEHAGADLEGPSADAIIASLSQTHADVAAAIGWAIELGHHDLAGDMVSALTLYWPASGRLDEAQRHLDRLMSTPGRRARHWWTQAYVAVYSGRIEQAIGAADIAAQLALDDDEPVMHARALDTGGFAAMYVDRNGALARLEEAVDMAEANGDRWCAADAAQILAFSRISYGEQSAPLALLDRSRAAALALDHAQLLAWDHAGRGVIELRRGHPVAALGQFAQAATQAARTGDPNITATVEAWSALARRTQGDAARQVDLLADQLDAALCAGAGQGALELAHALVECATQAGRHEVVDALWSSLEASVRREAPVSWSRLARSAALSLTKRGCTSDARPLLAQAARLSADLGHHLDVGATECVLAAVAVISGEVRSAEVHAAAAASALEHAEVLTDVHDLVVVLAAVASARGRHGEAQELIDLAGGTVFGEATVPSPIVSVLADRALVGDRGASGPHSADPHAALARWRRGRGARRPSRFGPTSVTSTEAEVARLAASGMSNRAIAVALHVAPGTVKSHLEHVYLKLGVANRTELAAWLHSTGDDAPA